MISRLIPALFAVSLPLMVAADEPTGLNVYTHPSFAAEWGPGPAVKEAFEAQCG